MPPQAHFTVLSPVKHLPSASQQAAPRLFRKAGYPLRRPEANPLTRFFSMHMKRMTTGMMAKMEAAKILPLDDV